MKFTICTTKGSPDSLKRDLSIVFTLTPEQSLGSYNPVAVAGMSFSSEAEESREFEWDLKLAFATYNIEEYEGRQCVRANDRSSYIQSGMQRRLDKDGQWGGPEFANTTLGLAAPTEGSQQSISLIMCVTHEEIPANLPIIAWNPTDKDVGASLNLVVQAYISDSADCGGTILKGSDRRRPLFTAPLNCNKIPTSSVWLLTEDGNGAIRLKRADVIPREKVELRGRHDGAVGFDEMKKQLDAVVKSLEETQRRLSVVERSVTANQTELRTAQTSLVTTREELSRLERKIPDVAGLATSLDRTEERLAVVETSVFEAREEVKALAEVYGKIPQQDNQDAPLAQVSFGSPGTSASQDQERPFAVGVDPVRPSERPAIQGGQGAGAPNSPRSGYAKGMRHQLLASRKTSSAAQEERTTTADSITTSRRHAAMVDRRIPAMEAKVDKLEISFGILERKLPTVEDKATRLEGLHNRTQGELSTLQTLMGTARDTLADLGLRVADVEMAMDQEAEPWDDPGILFSRSLPQQGSA